MSAKIGQKLLVQVLTSRAALSKIEHYSTILSIHQAAQVLGVSTKTLRRWEESKILIPLRSEGGHRRYRLSEIHKFKKHRDINKQSLHKTANSDSIKNSLIGQPKIDSVQVHVQDLSTSSERPSLPIELPVFEPLVTVQEQPEIVATKPAPEERFEYALNHKLEEGVFSQPTPAPVTLPFETEQLPVPSTVNLYQGLHHDQKRFLARGAVLVMAMVALFLLSRFVPGTAITQLGQRLPLPGSIRQVLEEKFQAFSQGADKRLLALKPNNKGKVLGDSEVTDDITFNVNVPTNLRNVFIQGDATASGSLNVGSGANIAGGADISGGANVTGGATIAGGAKVTGGATVAGGINVTSGNMNVATGGSYMINNVSVLNSTTLGAGVVNSSLTTVGNLSAGSIVDGFGSITTNNTITGTVINGTTSINTGGGTGTIRIDASGNLSNIGTITASGAVTFSNYGAGIAHFNGSGLISSSPVVLSSGDVSGILPIANGGTNGSATPTAGAIAYGTGTEYAFNAAGNSGECLVSGGASIPVWQSCSASSGNQWTLANGALYPNDSTTDLLIGSNATASAEFGVINLNSANATVQVSNGANLTVGNSNQFNVNNLGAIASATGITSSGSITFSGLNTAGGIVYTNGSGTLGTSVQGGSGECLVSSGAGAPSWQNCAGASGNQWTLANGILYPNISTVDLVVGGTSTASAEFSVKNLNTPNATVQITNGANLTVGDTNQFSVSTGGAVTAVGVSSGNGLIQGTGGLTVEGAININTTGLGNTSIGNGSGTVSLTLGSDATGDIFYRGSSGVVSRLPVGSNGFLLSVVGGLPSWINSSGSGAIGYWNRTGTDLTTTNANDTVTVNGLITGTAGLTITGGTANINATGGGNTSIGNGSGTVALTLGSDATGDVYYRNSSGNLTRLGIGTNGQALTVSAGGLPTWAGGSGGSGDSGFWNRTGSLLTPANPGDAISTSGNISTTGSGTISSAGTLTAGNGFTLSTGALNLTSSSGSAALTLSSSLTAFNVNAGVFDIDTTNGRVGIGTTAPAAPLSVGSTSQFQVSALGAVTAVGVNSGAGLLQGTGGLTVSGAVNINSTGTGSTSIGNGSGTVSLTLGSDATGDIYYRNVSGNLTRLPIGSTGQALTVTAGIPSWVGGSGTGTSGFWTRTGTTLTPSNAGDAVNVTSVLTSATSGNLGVFDWSPSSATVGTGDLLSLNVGANGSLANIFNVKNAGSSVFSVSQNQITAALPTQFTSPGDVSFGYDIQFTNPVASFIKSAAPLYVQAGEVTGSSDLTLRTFNQGTVVVSSGQTTGTILDITNTTLTSGIGFNISDTALTTGKLVNIAPTFAGSAVTGYGTYINGADSTANANTDYNLYSTLALTGNAAKTGVGLYSTVSTSSTTADTIAAADLATSVTGAISTGTRNTYGLRTQPASTAASTGGIQNLYGFYSNPSATLGAGATINSYGGYIGNTATVASGTVNGYGLYIANPTMNTTGTSTKTGLYVEDVTANAADTNYAAIFAGGNVGIGDTTPVSLLTVGSGDTFQVNTSGNIVKLNNLTTSFPSVQGAAGSTLTNDGTGVLSWVGGSGTGTSGFWTRTGTTLAPANAGDALSITSLLNTTTSGNLGVFDWSPSAATVGTGDLLSLNIGSNGTIGNIFNVKNAGSSVFSVGQSQITAALPTQFTSAGDVSMASDLQFTNPVASYVKSLAPLYIQAGESPNSSDLTLRTFNQGTVVVSSGQTTGTIFDITNTTLTTGIGLNISDTALTTGKLVNIAPTFAGSAVTGYGTYITGTDSTATANTDYNLYSTLALSGNAAKTGVGNYSTVTSSSTTADTLIAQDLATSVTGVITTGTQNVYGLRTQPTSTAASTGGTQNTYGFYSNPSNTLANGTTVNQYGGYISGTATVASGTLNRYGLYIDTASMNTTGTTTQYGLYVNTPAGADTNYGAVFAGGNVGIGTTTPTQLLQVVGSGSTTVNGLAGFSVPALATGNDVNISIGKSATSFQSALLGHHYDTVAANTYSYLVNYGDTVNKGLVVSQGGNIGIGTTTPGARLDVTDTSNTAASLSLTNNTATTIGAGANTLGVIDLQSTSLTTGNFMNVETNALTSGKALNVTSTSTALTTGSLGVFDWSPGSATTASGDLVSLNVGGNGIIGNIFNVKNAGSSVFSVGQAQITASLPTQFTAAGDTSFAYDLQFTNPVASYIKSAAPLYIQAGETFNSSNLTLKTYNSGQVVLDSPGGVSFINSSGTSMQMIETTGRLVSNLGTSTTNFFAGASAGNLTTTGTYDIGIGNSAGAALTSGTDNVMIGYQAGLLTTTGGTNILIGTSAGAALTTASSETFIGHQAGMANTSGASNTFVGYQSGKSITTASFNTFLGYGTGSAATNNANSNTLVGYFAGGGITSGTSNTAMGNVAGGNITTGTQSVLIGDSAGAALTTVGTQTFVGYAAGLVNTSGASNTFIGYQSGKGVTTNGFNTFVGYNTGISATNSGTNNTFMGYTAGTANTSGSSSTAIGYQAGAGMTTGGENTFLGTSAGAAVTTGARNVFIGNQVGSAGGTGVGDSVMIGYQSGRVNTGNQNTFVGFQTASSNTSGTQNVFLGWSSGANNVIGGANTYVGYGSGQNSTGGSNTFIGNNAGASNTSDFSTIIGSGAGVAASSTGSQVFIGYQAGAANTSGQNTFIGYQAGKANTSGTNNTFVGYNAGLLTTATSFANNTFIGSSAGQQVTTGTQNIYIGSSTAFRNTTGGSNVAIGVAMAGANVGSDSTFSQSVFIGNSVASGSGGALSSANDNVFVGYGAGNLITSVTQSVLIGSGAGGALSTTGSQTFIGYQAGAANTSGVNTLIGYQSGKTITTNTGNTYVGYQTGVAASNSGTNNTLLGYQAGTITTSASNNLLLGYQAGALVTTGGTNTLLGAATGGSLATGTGNVFIGYQAGGTETGSNKLYIANSNTTTPLIGGDFSTNTITYGNTGTTIDYASGTNGNTFIEKIPQLATTGTCSSAAAEGLIYKNTGGTQVGHICIDGPTSGTPNKLRFYAEQFNATSTDVAENYSDMTNALGAGDVVALDASAVKGVVKSTTANQDMMLGVVSTAPGLTLSGINEDGSTDLQHPKAVALNGRVPVKIATTSQDIKKGDYLTASDQAGRATKATASGQTLGRALEDWTPTNGKDSVLMFVNLSYFDADSTLAQSDLAHYSLLPVSNPAVKFALQTPFGATVTRILTASSAVIANVRAGDIQTQNLTAQTIATQALTIGGVSIDQYIAQVLAAQPVASGSSITAPVAPAPTPAPAPVAPISALQATASAQLISQSMDQIQLSAEDIHVQATAGSFDKFLKVNSSAYVGDMLGVANGLVLGRGLTITDQGLDFSDAVPVAQRQLSFLKGILQVNGEGKVIVNGSLEVTDHLSLSADAGGFAKIKAGDTQVHITFTNPYEVMPVITATSEQIGVTFGMKEKTTTGFTIYLNGAALQDQTFSWTAVQVKDAQTAVSGVVAGVSTSSAQVAP